MAQELAASLTSLKIEDAPSTPSPSDGSKGGKASRRRRKPPALPGVNAVPSPPLKLDGTPQKASPNPRFIVRKKEWGDMPDWIQLSDERGKSRPFPPLQEDPLFSDDGGPLLLPYLPPEGAPSGRGAAVVCPGGNYEFLHPREGAPVARWLAEALGVPAFVLRYRLLPQHGLDAMHADFFAAVLVYPCTNPDGWLVDDECGAAEPSGPSPAAPVPPSDRGALANALALHAQVGSTADDCCPVASDADPYVEAARGAGAAVEYLRGDYGDHGFGLKRFWAEPCAAWLRGLGFGAAAGEEPAPLVPMAASQDSFEMP